MKTEILSLQDRLNRLRDGQAAHPEYDGAVIRKMARAPIERYLGNYDAFCDLQAIIGVGESTPYHEAARTIFDTPCSPEEMGRIVDILAAPVAQIQEAFRQHDKALLPRYYTPRHTVPAQACLEERLENTGTIMAGPPYVCIRMPVLRFIRAVSELTGDSGFQDMYSSIQPHIQDDRVLFREAVYHLYCLQTPERIGLLYDILVAPFAKL